MTTSPAPAILYVDDERGNRVVFEQSFGHRFRIITAQSAEEALTTLESGSVGVVIADQRMPGMSGNDLLTRVKALYPSIIRAVITAYSDLEPIMKAVNDGLVARYVIKPWDQQELGAILEWAVQAYDVGRKDSALQLRLLQNERLATAGTISGAIVHDLAQPVSAMLNNIQHLVDQLPSLPTMGGLLEEHGGALSQRDRQNLSTLVADLPEILGELQYGCSLLAEIIRGTKRLVGASAQPDREVVGDPIPVIRYALSICLSSAHAANAKLSYEGPNELPGVRIGDTELTQVLINLLSNGIQALARVESARRNVTLRAEHDFDRVRFAIIDTGPGMEAETLAKAGTPFFTTHSEGTGLGLMQCRRLVESQGGQLQIESRPGEGTTIRFDVPALRS